MSSFSVVRLSVSNEVTGIGIGELVSLRIDLNGRLSTESGLLPFGLSFDLNFLEKRGDWVWVVVWGHGVNVTRLELRLEGGGLGSG